MLRKKGLAGANAMHLEGSSPNRGSEPQTPEIPPPESSGPCTPEDSPPSQSLPHSPDEPPPDEIHSPDEPPPMDDPGTPEDTPPPTSDPHTPEGPPPDFEDYAVDEEVAVRNRHSVETPVYDRYAVEDDEIVESHSSEGFDRRPNYGVEDETVRQTQSSKTSNYDLYEVDEEEGAGPVYDPYAVSDEESDHQPGKDDDDDELDEYVLMVIKIRNKAVELAGGESKWDSLDETERSILKDRAEKMV